MKTPRRAPVRPLASLLPTLSLLLSPAALLLLPAVMHASSSGRMPSAPVQPANPKQEAISLYNDGISYRDKAAKLEKEAADEADSGKKLKLQAKAKEKHEDAIKKFDQATKKDPAMYAAWGSLGYSYRKTGNYPASLDAYGKALEIQPDYSPAIEYRAEAYLAMDRLDDVKSAYMTLFNADRPRADELAAAIEKWLEAKRSNPAGLDPARLDEFSKWAAERKQLASQVSSVTRPKNERW